MTRLKKPEKEAAILEAAITVFAERGFWNTPTSLISKTAGIADGTLFTYFSTKEDLIHAVYVDIKHQMAEVLLEGFDQHQTIRERIYHIWDRYIDWGIGSPEKFAVMRQIYESVDLPDEVRMVGSEPFAEIEALTTPSGSGGLFHDYPSDYLVALLDSQVNTTIHFMTTRPDSDVDYKRIGFDILWNGVTR